MANARDYTFREKSELSSIQDSIDDNALPPSDTTEGWLVVFGAFVALMVSYGPLNAAGVLLEHYMSKVFPDAPTSTVSWIGTMQVGAMAFCCPFAGILMERFDARLVILVGSIISGSAYLVASACNSPVALIFTQGFLFGIGASNLMVAAMSFPSQWLQKNRALGSGLASIGGSIGGLWISFATQAILSNPSLGWRWALRITGLIIIGAGSAVSPLLKNRLGIQKRTHFIDFTILKDWRFLVLSLIIISGCGNYFLTYSYMPPFSVEVLHQPANWSANISSILNASSIIGRVLIGFMADYVGNINSLIISSVISAITLLAIWLPYKDINVLIGAAVMFGFFGGSFSAFTPTVAAQLFGISRLPTILGLVFVSYTIGSFVSVPTAGLLLDKYGNGNDFTPVILYGGSFCCLLTLCVIVLRLSAGQATWKA